MDHAIAIGALRDVTERNGFLGRKLVISYSSQKLHRVELRLRRHDAFVADLRQLGVPINAI